MRSKIVLSTTFSLAALGLVFGEAASSAANLSPELVKTTQSHKELLATNNQNQNNKSIEMAEAAKPQSLLSIVDALA